jgi:Na+/H+ antiporter NhaD/arsenite permease-like protein
LHQALGGVIALSVLPTTAVVANEGALGLPLWTAAPFVLLLLAIALLPLLADWFWRHHHYKALVVLVLAVPVAGYLLYLGPYTGHHSTRILLHELGQYGSFIILLASLYTVSGGILLSGDIRATPLTNAAFLGLGAVLANVIGTTGASMLLIRPLLQINRRRQHARHLAVFFIFLVSNLGGVLTPLGDPPLFLGFLNGVDFFWTLRLWPQWLVANGLVLLVFVAWEAWASGREPPPAPVPDAPAGEPLRLRGTVNLLFLAGIVAGVVLQSPRVGEACGAALSHVFPCPPLTLSPPWGEVLMVLMALLSLAVTPRALRKGNGFNWGAMIEVAVLFAGIFVTMVPALTWLREQGPSLGVTKPWQFFWLAGGLSSVLDNAPTYLTFATLAASPQTDFGWLVENRPLVLKAISCGAVFMGANTYIGNGPNFMVKAIADEAGFRTPSFFGYLLYSGLVLLPVFVLVMFLFFWNG